MIQYTISYICFNNKNLHLKIINSKQNEQKTQILVKKLIRQAGHYPQFRQS